MNDLQVGDEVRILGDKDIFNVTVGNKYKITDFASDGRPMIKNDCNTPQYLESLVRWELVEKKENGDFQPFYVEVDGPQHSRMLQEIAIEEGFDWKGFSSGISYVDSSPFLEFGEVSDSSISRFTNEENEEVWDEGLPPKLEDFTIKEFRQALNGNYDFSESIEVFGYEVEFRDENKCIKVGCETFTYGEIRRLYEASSLSNINIDITISHINEGEIPFDVIESIYNRIKK